MVNEEKVNRTIHGSQTSKGELKGGVGEGEGEEWENKVLAEYDRLGGLIRLNGDRVKTGSFYDFKGRKPLEESNVMLQFNVNGKVMEVSADEPLPPLVRAAKAAEQGEEADPKIVDEESDEPESKSTSLIGAGKRAPKRAPKTDEGAE